MPSRSWASTASELSPFGEAPWLAESKQPSSTSYLWKVLRPWNLSVWTPIDISVWTPIILIFWYILEFPFSQCHSVLNFLHMWKSKSEQHQVFYVIAVWLRRNQCIDEQNFPTVKLGSWEGLHPSCRGLVLLKLESPISSESYCKHFALACPTIEPLTWSHQ